MLFWQDFAYIRIVNQSRIVLLCLLFTACDPKDSPRPADPPPTAPKAETTGAATEEKTDNSNLASVQDRLTQTLRKFSAEQQRVPKALNELVAAGYLQTIPSAPSGKKWVINPKRVQVELD